MIQPTYNREYIVEEQYVYSAFAGYLGWGMLGMNVHVSIMINYDPPYHNLYNCVHV